MLTVHHPVGYPPRITRKQPAPRPASLDGRTVFLVDSRFDDSVELLRQVQAWFGRNLPSIFNYRKFGFAHVGTLHRCRRDAATGEVNDMLFFEMFRDEWLARRERKDA